MVQVGGNWNEWTIAEFLGEGSFGKVYRITREEFGQTYESALKVIRIPQTGSEVESMRSEGMSQESVTDYYRSVVEDIVSEFALMSRLRGNSNIVSYEDHKVMELDDEFGWEIYIRMELLDPLIKYLDGGILPEQDVIRLGIDMCKALEVCQKNNIIHRDVKPENIFHSQLGTFKLGDFGIARQFEKTSSGMSKKGTYSYMAPEVYQGRAYNGTVDIYSLGIVMYRYLNNNRGPFLPPFPDPIRYSDKEEANARRMRGEPLPKPCKADDPLAQIVMKACAYYPGDRFQSAAAMRKALEDLQSGTKRPADGPAVFEEAMETTVLLQEDGPYGTGSGPSYRTGNSGSYGTGSGPSFRTGSSGSYGAGSGPSYRTGSSGSYGAGSGPSYRTGSGPIPKTPSAPARGQLKRKSRLIIPILAAAIIIVFAIAGFRMGSESEEKTEEGPIEVDPINVTVLDSDWDWDKVVRRNSDDGLYHVDGNLLVKNEGDQPISQIRFTVDTDKGSNIENDADPGKPFLAEGFVDAHSRGIMWADIGKEKYFKGNKVQPDVRSYMVQEAELSPAIVEGYQTPAGKIKVQRGEDYDLYISNPNTVPVNKRSKVVAVKYEDGKKTRIAEAVATGVLPEKIGPEERDVPVKNVFHDPNLHGDIEPFKIYVLDLEYYRSDPN